MGERYFNGKPAADIYRESIKKSDELKKEILSEEEKEKILAGGLIFKVKK